MNNKLNNMIQEFINNSDTKNMEELNGKLMEFITKYNNGEIEYENTPMDDALELLEKAEYARNKSEAIRLAKKAYKICPDCLDAILFQVRLEPNPRKRNELLNEGLKNEEKRLKEKNYFDKENIGHFYGIFEIRGLYLKASYLLEVGEIESAENVCKEILKLNENDNTGSRYLLMGIYAILTKEQDLLKLSKKYSENALEVLFPLFALYYNLDNTKKAKEYLKKINESNSHFIKYFKGPLKPNKDVIQGCYVKGEVSEVIMYFSQYRFLIDTLPNLKEFVLENDNQK